MLLKLRDTRLYVAVFAFVIRVIIFGSRGYNSAQPGSSVRGRRSVQGISLYLTEREMAWNERAIWASVAAMLVTLVAWVKVFRTQDRIATEGGGSSC